MRLAENMKQYRKRCAMTQEQLAEAMGVTCGTVSKWESGACQPDLDTLMELADLFQASTDALLGYELHEAGPEEQAAEVKRCYGSRDFVRGKHLAEKALKNFPNHFGVVYQSAVLYEMTGLDTDDRSAFRRAIDLYRRALGLLDQNRDPSVGPCALRSHIAQCWQGLEEYDKALELLRTCNEGGLYDDHLGILLMKLHRWDEAVQTLSESMLEALTRLERSAMGLWNCLSEGRGDNREALELQHWMIGVYESLYPETPCFLHKLNAAMYAGCAVLALRLGEEQEAVGYLRQAREAAAAFDTAPDYRADNLRFYHGRSATSHDDFGATALEGVRLTLERQEEPERAALLALWERV